MKEPWQPNRESVSSIETDTDMISIKDPRDEKKEVATMEQQSGNGNYTREAADEPNVREKLTKESW